MSLHFEPFNVITISSSMGAGKSHLIKYLVKKMTTGPNRINSALVFTQTKFSDMNQLDWIDESHVFGEYDEEVIAAYLNYHVEHPNKIGLLVFDDVCGMDTFSSPLFKSLVTNHRHYHVNIIMSLQYMKSIPLLIRTVTNFYITFYSSNRRLIDALYDEYGGELTKPEFTSLITRLQRYQFLWIDAHESDVYQKYRILRAPAKIPAFKLKF